MTPNEPSNDVQTRVFEALKTSLDRQRIIEKLKELRYEEALGIPLTGTNAEASAAFVRLSARFAGEEPVRIALNRARGAMLAESDLERGRRLARLGDCEAAVAFFQRAVVRDAGVEANRELGRTLTHLDRKDEAVFYLDQAALLSDLAEDHLWLGATLANMGKHKAALKPLREAARRRGSCADHEWLADALLELGRLAESLPHLRKIVELRGNPGDRLRLDETLAELARQTPPEPATANVAASQPGGQLQLFEADPAVNGTISYFIASSPHPLQLVEVNPVVNGTANLAASQAEEQPTEASAPEAPPAAEQAAPPTEKSPDPNAAVPDVYSGFSLRWSDLSKEAQSWFLSLTGKTSPLVLWSYPLMTAGSIAWRALAALACLGCMCYWIIAAEDASTLFVALAVCSFGLYQLAVVAFYLWFHFHGPLHANLYLTPTYLIHAQGKRISAWPLWQIRWVQQLDDAYAGVRRYSKFKFWLQDYSFSISVFHAERALALRSQYQAALERARSEASRANAQYIESADPFSGMRRNTPPRPRRSFTRNCLLNRCAMLAVAVLLTGLIALPARQLQDWYEDNRQWTQARAVGSATAFRAYVQQRPNGRYAGPAEQRLQQVYTDASQHFNASAVVDGSDPSARDAVLEMLQEAARTGGYKVGVYFERQNQIPANVEESIQRRFRVSRVSPIGDAFLDANMRAREESIVMHIRDAFGKLIPGDVLVFELSPEKLPPLWLTVTYRVRAGDSIYYDTKEESLNEDDRSYYPGVFFDWQIELCPGELKRRYVFKMSSRPSHDIQVGNSVSSIYAAMSDSAFASLEREIERRFGLTGGPLLNSADSGFQ